MTHKGMIRPLAVRWLCWPNSRLGAEHVNKHFDKIWKSCWRCKMLPLWSLPNAIDLVSVEVLHAVGRVSRKIYRTKLNRTMIQKRMKDAFSVHVRGHVACLEYSIQPNNVIVRSSGCDWCKKSNQSESGLERFLASIVKTCFACLRRAESGLFVLPMSYRLHTFKA